MINFATVQIRRLFSAPSVKTIMGGEIQRENFTHDMGYSVKARCTGKSSYLEPISGSMHVPIEGGYRVSEKIEYRSRIGEKQRQNHVENAAQTYLKRVKILCRNL